MNRVSSRLAILIRPRGFTSFGTINDYAKNNNAEQKE
jgi:hypothetical protein